jgi:hypothetical protein
MAKAVAVVSDANGDVLKVFVIEDGWNGLKPLQKRVSATGCYLDLHSVRGDESQLTQYVKQLEKECE